MFLFIFLLVFVSVIWLITYLNNQNRKKQWSSVADTLGSRVIAQLERVKCETFYSGAKNGGQNFTHCHLYLTDDALVIFGYSKVLMIKQLRVPLVLTRNSSFYAFVSPYSQLIKPKKINLNSFNGDIYIEFEQPGLIRTNVEIRLKEISSDLKNRLEFLNTI